MRRKDKEVSDQSEIEAIIKKSNVCRLAMIDGDRPYIVPLCFGYQNNTLYFHGASKGRKIDLLRENPNVCFELDLIIEIVEAENACKWSLKYQSVVGYGRAFLLESADERIKGLKIIMSQYSERTYQFPEDKLGATAVFKVEIDSMTGKQSGF
jgi:nitroimidazol reductase NimA-like FMN-containing flavoprotein (pyridoxamine 5'-phosphate oxidase superfamily)